MCLVAHKGNLYNFPLLQAELAKTVVEFGLDIFGVYFLEIFINSLNNPLVKEAKPADLGENTEDNVEYFIIF